MVDTKKIRIGTRGSDLALAQARLVAATLAAAHPALQEQGRIDIAPIVTTGDREAERRLADIGGKGLFTKEIEEALFAGSVDLAVHSYKDMPTLLPQGLTIAAVLPRADPRDALISHRHTSFAALPHGARVGTSSLRRTAQIKILRPDVAIVPLRGNVPTRLKKIAAGEAEATLLALAGLTRLGLAERATEILDAERFLPAVAQGAIAIECRENDAEVLALLAAINHLPSMLATSAERAMLATLDGSCRTPIAGYATLAGDRLHLRGLVAAPDGSAHHRAERTGDANDFHALGIEVGEELLRNGAQKFFTP